jgi:hypothetical protein
MNRFLDDIVLLGFAAIAGGLTFVPRFAALRRPLLWSAALLAVSAVLWHADTTLHGLDGILPNSPSFIDIALRVVLWSVAALLGVTLVRFALDRRLITE